MQAIHVIIHKDLLFMPSTNFLFTTASRYCKSSILAQMIPPPQQTHLKGAEENQRPSLQYEETQRSSLQSSLNNSTPPMVCPALIGRTVAKGNVDFIFGNAAAVLQGCNLHAHHPLPNHAAGKRRWKVFGGVYAHLQSVWFSISFFMVSDGKGKW